MSPGGAGQTAKSSVRKRKKRAVSVPSRVQASDDVSSLSRTHRGPGGVLKLSQSIRSEYWGEIIDDGVYGPGAEFR